MIRLTLTEDDIGFAGGERTQAEQEGFIVPADIAGNVLQLMERVPPVYRPVAEWRKLAAEPENFRRTGWHLGTRWIDGTPAPLIAARMRPGCGLLPEKQQWALPTPEAKAKRGSHEIALCKQCKRTKPLAEMAIIRENRKGYFGTCKKCEGKEAA